MRRLGALVAATAVIGISLVAAPGGGTGGVPSSARAAGVSEADGSACETSPGPGVKTTEIATAKLIIEYNSTDDDIGVHGAFDDHGWKTLCVFDPAGRAVLEVGPQGSLRDLTMAGIFFESREPPASEFSFADLKAAFPEGEYSVSAESFDGKVLVGSATFTHQVPAAPRISAPAIAEEPRDTKRNPVPLEDLQIRWGKVTRTVDGGPVTITGYEVILTKEVEDDPNGFSRPVYDVHVPTTVNSLRVPAEFLEPGTVYELEVLALEQSGNQTISVGFLRTE